MNSVSHIQTVRNSLLDYSCVSSHAVDAGALSSLLFPHCFFPGLFEKPDRNAPVRSSSAAAFWFGRSSFKQVMGNGGSVDTGTLLLFFIRISSFEMTQAHWWLLLLLPLQDHFVISTPGVDFSIMFPFQLLCSLKHFTQDIITLPRTKVWSLMAW